MPVSKKRRRKKSNAPSSRSTSTVVTLPDRRAMEGFMSGIGGRRTNDATAKAQEVMYEAWDQTSPRARVALADAFRSATEARDNRPVPAGSHRRVLLAQLSFRRSTATIVFPKESETWRQVL
jgi:hypothetical protein